MRTLSSLQEHWEGFAREDPLWAILTIPEKRRGKWDLAEFFHSGEEEVRRVLAYIAERGIDVDVAGAALDFGCGVGRLTQALAGYFARCTGIDISPTMIELARKHNRAGDRCAYRLNEGERIDLPDASFSFIYTSIVLQHIEWIYTRNYLREFVRLLAPGGVLVFQIPTRHHMSRVLELRRALKLGIRARQVLRALGLRRSSQNTNVMDMHCVPDEEIRALFAAMPVEIMDAAFTNSTRLDFDGRLTFSSVEPDDEFVSTQFVVRKRRE
jgi:ubiquinone/menaquinone biosynthesis C-methylase UbiE